ncbi:MAG: T9SS type A sorting domain-containing protein [Candidatus Eisenbacteria bacterium]|nr:T9SS type A sorting domain-containing protein [Candidatus Eisenbacteria bacterium]
MKVGFTIDGGAYGGVPNLGTSGPDTSVACCTDTLVPRCNRFVPDQAPQNHKYVSVLSDDTVDAYLNWWQSPWKPHFDDGRFDGPVNWDPMLDSDPGPQRSGDDAPQESALRLSLSQNCPNPFNPITTIRFAVPKTGRIKLTVYDIAGRQVRRLIDGLSAPGRHEATWDGRDDAGERVASGVYFLRLEDGHSIASRKLVLLK